MVTAVLVSFEDDGVLAMPSEPIDLNKNSLQNPQVYKYARHLHETHKG